VFLIHARKGFALTLALSLTLPALPAAQAAVHPLPLVPDVQPSSLYRVFVAGQEVPVGVETTGGKTFHVTSFLFSGRAELRIVVHQPFTKCTIRPLRFALSEQARIADAVSGEKEIHLTLDEPRKLIIELEGLDPLVLIGSPPDQSPPDPNDPNVIYFPPGVHEPGRIRLQDNQTVYLAEGAKVYGTIEAMCVKNVRVTGRGHLYGTKHTTWNDRIYGLVFDRCQNVTVENIGIRDCYWWTTEFLLCDGVDIRNINILTFNRNNGGLMIDSCSNLSARDCLLMTMDDCICPHALNAAGNGEEPSDGMRFEDLVLYNEFTGNAIRIGASFETSEVRNWTFRNIDVVHRHGAAVYSDHSDWALVRNLVFENFVDEASHRNSIDMRIGKTVYSCQTGYRDARGAFDGLHFINMKSHGGGIRLRGFDEDHAFNNVIFTGCSIKGGPVKAADVETNEFVYNLKLNPPPSKGGARGGINEGSRSSAYEVPTVLTTAAETDRSNDEAGPPQVLLIDDGDEGFRSYGFAPDAQTVNAWNGDARIGEVADAFGKYAAAIYEPKLKGRYEVHAYWGGVADADENAAWIIKHADGYGVEYVNQRKNPGWHRLGSFDMDAKSNVRLVFPNYFEPTRRPVVADAVKFVRVESGGD